MTVDKNMSSDQYYIIAHAKEMIIEPTRVLLESKPTDTVPLQYLRKVYIYLDRNEHELFVLNHWIENGKYDGENLEIIKLKDDLNGNVKALKKILKDYEERIKAEIADINIDNIKKIFEKFNLDMAKIKLIYEDPMVDQSSGKIIRNTMAALGKFESRKDWAYVEEQLDKCKQELIMTNSVIEGIEEYKIPVRKALLEVQESLCELLKIK